MGYRLAAALILCGAAGCGRVGFAAGAQVDAAADGRTTDALGPWGNDHLIGELVNAASQDDPTLATDELELFFQSKATGGHGDCDIWTATRSALTAPWSPPVPLDLAVNSAACDSSPEISADDLTLWFSSGRTGLAQLYEAHRADRASPWQAAALVTGVNSTASDLGPSVTADELTLVFYSDRAGTHDLYVSHRSVKTAAWGAPAPISELNSSADERSPGISHDGAKLWFVSSAAGSQDIYVGVKGPDGRFDSHRIDELSTATGDDDPWVSRDEHRIYFARDRVGVPGVSDLLMADR